MIAGIAKRSSILLGCLGGICLAIWPVRAELVALPAIAGAAPAAGSPRGVHIPQGQRVSFTYQMTDGAGYRWDIQYYGTVGSGTNSAFGGGMYCQVSGSNIRSNGNGWLNNTSDELEIGPYTRNNLRCWRRIKVYRDRGLARWLDIFENPTPQPITVPVRIYSNRNYTIRSTLTSSGKSVFGPKDWALITQSSGSSSPQVLEIVCSKNSKVRPTVSVQSSNIYLNYTVTVPAGKTAILCHFVAQNSSREELVKAMRTFRAYKMLRDLSPEARKLILNFRSGGGVDGVDLDRSEAADTVLLKSGDPIFGEVTNKKFVVQTFFGPLELPAEQVLGMAAGADEEDASDEQMRFALVSGQIVSGKAPQEKLTIKLPAGGTLNIPLEDIRQWSYKIAPSRPAESTFTDPYVMLRTGDKLAFDPKGLDLSLLSRYGEVPLAPDAMLDILLDNEGNGVHRAIFRNGSRLGGFLQPAKLKLKLKIGRELEISRDKVARIRFAEEGTPDDSLTHLRLSNEDELVGRLVDEKIQFVTRYNPIPLRPESIRAIHRGHEQTMVEMWNGTVHTGRLGQTHIGFEIVPGPKLKIHVDHLLDLSQPRPLPPASTRKLVAELVAQLGAESYKDRQEATDRLMKMKGIGPLLVKYLKHADPEVRHRVEEILEKSGEVNRVPGTTSSSGQPRPEVMLRGIRR